MSNDSTFINLISLKRPSRSQGQGLDLICTSFFSLITLISSLHSLGLNIPGTSHPLSHVQLTPSTFPSPPTLSQTCPSNLCQNVTYTDTFFYCLTSNHSPPPKRPLPTHFTLWHCSAPDMPWMLPLFIPTENKLHKGAFVSFVPYRRLDAY